MISKPLLAYSKFPCLDSDVRYPCLVSPKLDGIRCVKVNGRALTRTFKPIPNKYVRDWIEAWMPDGIDGELLLPDLTASFNDVQSAIMSKDGEPDFRFGAFDFVRDGTQLPFEQRYRSLTNWACGAEGLAPYFFVVKHAKVDDRESVELAYHECLAAGYEGLMIRSIDGYYKQGRSGKKEGILFKLKMFEDEEAEVIGVEEEMQNTNAQTRNAVGKAERSSAKAGLKGKGQMGKLILRTLRDSVEFGCGSGFTQAQKKQIWDSVSVDNGVPQHDVIGAIVKFKHQPPPGGRQDGQKPRIPVFLGFRNQGE